jgi:hypothetical protein
MYPSRAPLAAFLAGMAGALQDELAPFAPERRAEKPVIRSNATMCCLFSGEIAARGDSGVYATEGPAVTDFVEGLLPSQSFQ